MYGETTVNEASQTKPKVVVDMVSLLVVEDQPSLRRLLEMVAEQDARIARVVSAASLAEALEQAEREQPHVIVLDADLRGEDGLSGIGPLRLRSPHAAVIVFSSAPYASEAMARRAGADQFVEKGTDLDTLLDLVVEAAASRHVVDLRDQESTAARPPALP